MARFYFNWTLCQCNCLPQLNGRFSKAALVLIGLVCFIIIGITIFETHGIWKQQKNIDVHFADQARKKVSVAVATDTKNPDYHYGVVVDCGSSGSRVYVYFWPPHNGNPKELLFIQPMLDRNLNPVVKKIEPGLATFAEKPAAASDYLRPLLQYATEHVPAEKHKETPLYVLATAGMRVIPESQQKEILDDIRVDVPMEFKFMFPERHIEVISGKEEGVFAWIAMNYALNRFDHSYHDDDPLIVSNVPGSDRGGLPHIRKRTVGILDMGGGSLQVAFEVPQSVRFSLPKEKLAKDLLAEFNLGCKDADAEHTYRVYVTTFLGFGSNSARKRYEEALISNAIDTTSTMGKIPSRPLLDPCLHLDMPLTVKANNTQFYLKGTGMYDTCQEQVKPLLNISSICDKTPCIMNGKYMPEVNHRNSEFYGFSEFWYCTDDVFRIGGKYNYVKFKKAAKDYCGTNWKIIEERHKKGLYPNAEYSRVRSQCFKSAWMTTVLHDGLHFPRLYKEFTSAKLVNGREIQWTLGALLFKTRYYPLRAVEKHESLHYKPPWFSNNILSNQYLLIVCIVVVIIAIVLYIRRLRRMTMVDFKRVPSMSYFMTDDDQVPPTVRVERTYTFN